MKNLISFSSLFKYRIQINVIVDVLLIFRFHKRKKELSKIICLKSKEIIEIVRLNMVFPPLKNFYRRDVLQISFSNLKKKCNN